MCVCVCVCVCVRTRAGYSCDCAKMRRVKISFVVVLCRFHLSFLACNNNSYLIKKESLSFKQQENRLSIAETTEIRKISGCSPFIK